MPNILTKICGLSTPETVAAAANGGADYLGFVNFRKSPRHVELARAAQLARYATDSKTVLLLVNPEMPTIDQAIDVMRPDVIQLHGKENPDFVAEIRQRHDVILWKAVSVKTFADVTAAKQYKDSVERILFDAKPPSGSELPGGNGLRFDWGILKGIQIPFSWGLSGGLALDNISEAVRVTGAPFVDISSGVEDAPGQKNVDKIASFLNAVHNL